MQQLTFSVLICLTFTCLGALSFAKNRPTFEVNEIGKGNVTDSTAILAAKAKQLMASSDCRACHNMQTRAVGPAYKEIAKKYRDDKSVSERLAKKVIAGGRGAWGESTMSAHPGLSMSDATLIVSYILSLAEENSSSK